MFTKVQIAWPGRSFISTSVLHSASERKPEYRKVTAGHGPILSPNAVCIQS